MSFYPVSLHLVLFSSGHNEIFLTKKTKSFKNIKNRWLGEEYRAASSRPISAAAAAVSAGGGSSSRPSSGGSCGGKRRSSSGGRGRGKQAAKTPPQANNPSDLLRFEFDGDAVNGESETAETLDLEDDEVIDVHVLR